MCHILKGAIPQCLLLLKGAIPQCLLLKEKFRFNNLLLTH